MDRFEHVHVEKALYKYTFLPVLHYQLNVLFNMIDIAHFKVARNGSKTSKSVEL